MEGNRDKTKIKRILLIRLSSLGDLVHTFPAASVIKKNYPKASLYWIVEDKYLPILKTYKNVDEVIGIPRVRWEKLFKTLAWNSLKREIGSLKKKLRERNFEIVFDLHNILRSGIITGFSGAEVRWGYGSREGNGFFINNRYPYPWNKKNHPVDQHLRALESINLKSKEVDFGLKNLPFPKGFPEENPYVIIHPRTRWETKNWAISRYVELGQKIANLGFGVFFTGSQEDGGLISEEIKGKNGLTSIAGIFSMEELVPIVRGATLFIGGDTGPMHIAAATGTKVLAIMGPTSEERFGPYGQKNSVIKASLDCLGCEKRKCKKPFCMENVTVEMVWNKARENLLKGNHMG